MAYRNLTLSGNTIELRPLHYSDEAGLIRTVSDGDLWKLKVTLVPCPENVKIYIRQALKAEKRGLELPFVICEKQSGQIVGSTRFSDIDMLNNSVGIGSTFLGRSFQGRHINREAKKLMLDFAFEQWEVKRVEFMIDERNTPSQRAIEQLGAIKEETLDRQSMMPDWDHRYTILYTIYRGNWEKIKENMQKTPKIHAN